MPDNLLKLAERAEQATADGQAAVLREAFEAIHGPKPSRVHGGSPELTIWLSLFNPFFYMLEAKAFESAALTLVPKGVGWALFDGKTVLTPDKGAQFFGDAATPALALVAASLRARAAMDATPETKEG